MSTEWMDRALCAQIGPDLWFPEKGWKAPEARRICRRCPVARECLEYALEADEVLDGIWGGLSEPQRRKLRRKLRRKRAA